MSLLIILCLQSILLLTNKNTENTNTKKGKGIGEDQIFKEQWTKKYFFTYYSGKSTYLTCMSVLKEYNLKHN